MAVTATEMISFPEYVSHCVVTFVAIVHRNLQQVVA